MITEVMKYRPKSTSSSTVGREARVGRVCHSSSISSVMLASRSRSSRGSSEALFVFPGHHLRDLAQLDQHFFAFGFGRVRGQDQADAQMVEQGAHLFGVGSGVVQMCQSRCQWIRPAGLWLRGCAARECAADLRRY